jgi:hypothetical protein
LQSDDELPNSPPKKWAEGMAGLSTLMSCCSQMGGTLSAEDKVLFSSLVQIQGRLAALTTVVDTPEGDHDMSDAETVVTKSTRAEGGKEASAQSKRQKKDAEGTQSPQENAGGEASSAGVVSGSAAD